MPRPRKKESPAQESAQSEAAAIGVAEPERAAADIPEQDSIPAETQSAQEDAIPAVPETREDSPEPALPAPDSTGEDAAPARGESHAAESAEPLAEGLAASLGADIQALIQNFGINGHRPESVYEFLMAVTEPVRRARAAGQALDGLPMAPPIPLDAHITSLEMDGDTIAFARVAYGELTIERIRVKKDGFGALSVSMPKYRQPGGWKETCRFNTPEARNRLAAAVLDAYGQTVAHMQGHAQAEAVAQDVEQVGARDHDAPAHDGHAMGMSL